MNKEFAGQEDKELTSEQKLFGLPRPWAGATVGVALFFLIEFLLWRAEPGELAMGLNYPGLLVEALGIPLDFFVIGLSSIPAAIIGSLIISRKVTQRTFGIILLVAYVLLWIISTIFLIILSD